jgi:predicted DCC family thiol-disulfide oxidoreductase YuxK
MGRLFPEEINMIYDSKCNVCKLEIDFLAKRDAEKVNAGAPKLKMTDLEGETYDENDPANGGISYKEGMAAIHAVTADGKVIKGVPVFALAYEQVKLGWLFKITTWPILKQIVDVGYTIFAKYRTILTRGASVESLVKEYEAKKALREKMEDADCAACKSKEP